MRKESDNRIFIKGKPDYYLLFTIVFLIFWGVVMVFSASAIQASERLSSPYYFLSRQICWALMGIIMMLTLSRIDYRRLHSFSRPLAVLSFVLLIIVLIPGIGRSVNNASRWFKLGPVSFQPSEFVKLFLIIYLADALDRKKSRIRKFRGFLPLMALAFLFSYLVYLEPDFGNAIIIGVLFFTYLFIGKAKGRYLLLILAIVVPIVLLSLFSVEYRKLRVISFLNPWDDSRGSGYQLTQSLMALGSGGLWGKGLGGGESKLLYLPEPHTDFIFSVIGEELGFIGTTFILFLFIFFALRGLRISLRAPDVFSRNLAFGITFLIVLEALLNIAVVSGWLPTKGLPLPFLSYGGSSLLSNLMGIGILISISRKVEHQ